MMCKAEVTGSMTPTVAKHTQSVEPAVGTVQKHAQRHACGRKPNTRTVDRNRRRYQREWCQCAAGRPAKRRPGRSHSGRLPAACGPPLRGALRWTCRHRPHTRRCRWKNRTRIRFTFSAKSTCAGDRGLTRQSQPGLSSGGDLWPGLPVLSLDGWMGDNWSHGEMHFFTAVQREK